MSIVGVGFPVVYLYPFEGSPDDSFESALHYGIIKLDIGGWEEVVQIISHQAKSLMLEVGVNEVFFHLIIPNLTAYILSSACLLHLFFCFTSSIRLSHYCMVVLPVRTTRCWSNFSYFCGLSFLLLHCFWLDLTLQLFDKIEELHVEWYDFFFSQSAGGQIEHYFHEGHPKGNYIWRKNFGRLEERSIKHQGVVNLKSHDVFFAFAIDVGL